MSGGRPSKQRHDERRAAEREAIVALLGLGQDAEDWSLTTLRALEKIYIDVQRLKAKLGVSLDE